MKTPHKTYLKIAVLLLAVLLLFVFLPVREWLSSFNEFVAGLGVWGMLLFIVVYMVAAVFMIPGSVLTLGAGFAFGLVNGMIAVSLGSTLGAGAAFLVSRYLARDRVRAKFATGERFQSVDEAVAEQGWKIVGLLRLSPVFPYNVLNVLLGLTGIKFWHYLIASWLGMLPGTLLYVYIGYAARTAADEPDTLRTIYTVVGLIITLGVTLYVTRLARNAMKKTTPLPCVHS
ncbi:MAG: TVP38/TMEM64 family protein [Verrucomicrobia bacterium]|nr:TVP38/TMEM64 family protein [Verrucomicrobiota bacterium]MCH8513905.1 TVP38/TMEM64 family protein [Kiritimatiellia bacterium]